VEQRGKALWAVFALIGFTAVAAQVLLMRELIVVFYGNEISLGLMLAGWLLWTAFGSGVLGRRTKGANPRRLVAALELLLAIAFPLGLMAARASRLVFQTVPGEMLGPGAMLVSSFAALAVFCTCSGLLFAAAARLPAAESGVSAAQASASVYLAEAVGSAAGGLLASLVFVRWLTPMQTAAVPAALNVGAAVFVLRRSRPAGFAVTLALVLGGGCWLAAPALERVSLGWLWHGFQVVESRNSVYGNLVLTRTGDNLNLYENGLAVATVPDPASAEEAVHYALLQHRAPRSVLLVGGGENGSLAQVLLHPTIQRVDYVELDPAILDLARRYFPLPADPRVHVHQGDGRLYLHHTSQRFDVIVVNLPEPQTAQLNRFYTLEFFREAVQKLTAGGVFSFGLPSSENYISPELADFLRSIDHTLREAFPEVTVLPGETVHFFASNRKGVLLSDANAILARLRERRLHTLYVSEYFLPFRMMPDRVRELDERIRPRPDTPLNQDFAPKAYYFDTVLWSARVASGSRRWFRALANVPLAAPALAAALLLAGAAAVSRKGTRRPAAFAVATMGFVMLGLEVLLLLGFQAIHGYVYGELALVIAGFMAGLAWGSRAALRRGGGWRALVVVQGLGAAAPLALFGLFVALGRLGSDALSLVLFPALAVGCGALGGYQFPLASRMYYGDSNAERSGLGALYSVDLAGSCIAALALSAWMIPVFGFLYTALLLAMVNAVPAGLLWLTQRRA
jgi:spermidine synthase